MLTPSIPHRPTHPSTISNYLRPPSLLHTNRTKSNAAKPSHTTTPLPPSPPLPPRPSPLGQPTLPLRALQSSLGPHRSPPSHNSSRFPSNCASTAHCRRPAQSLHLWPSRMKEHHITPNSTLNAQLEVQAQKGKRRQTDRQRGREGGRKNQKSERGGCQGECSE